MKKRPRHSFLRAVIASLQDGVPKNISHVHSIVGGTHEGVRTRLQKAAQYGYIVRDSRELHLGREQRLYTLPEYEHTLPSSDKPWFEEEAGRKK